MGKFASIFGKLEDPRASNRRHDMLEVLFIALLAIMAGADGAAEMARFGRAKEELLRQFLPLENGVPSHDTFSRVFRLLEPVAFGRQFRKFVRAFARFNKIGLKGVLAIDGKSLRRAYDRGKSATPLHIVNVFATQARLALAARKAPGRNEVEGALEILRSLQLKHHTVTGDALFCGRPIAKLILERGGNYVLALKGNQNKLFRAVERKTFFNETDETVALKVKAALRHGLLALVCIGDTKAEYDAGRTAEVLEKQTRAALSHAGKAAFGNVIFAYEPVWSIGEGGTPASPDFANGQHKLIKAVTAVAAGTELPVLYGGSVNPQNCHDLASQSHIDGLFIGRSAWNAAGFIGIIEAVTSALGETS